jgi:multidrug efflux system membrane fusion protein
MTVIETGLQKGEQVVIDGQMRVVPGGKVEVKQPADRNNSPAKPGEKK